MFFVGFVVSVLQQHLAEAFQVFGREGPHAVAAQRGRPPPVPVQQQPVMFPAQQQAAAAVLLDGPAAGPQLPDLLRDIDPGLRRCQVAENSSASSGMVGEGAEGDRASRICMAIPVFGSDSSVLMILLSLC